MVNRAYLCTHCGHNSYLCEYFLHRYTLNYVFYECKLVGEARSLVITIVEAMYREENPYSDVMQVASYFYISN